MRGLSWVAGPFTSYRNGTIAFRASNTVIDRYLNSWIGKGAVEKSRQRRSPHFSVLTYWKYALRAKMTAALLDNFFEQPQGL